MSDNIHNLEYMVSVRLMTYNHESYIKNAMDGIFSQKIDFPIEVVVGDDFSTDRTLDIVREYSDTDNIHVKVLERKKGDSYWHKRQRLGRLYNFVDIIEHCNGKYLALLDGDDYWTDEKKLQKQVDFLEVNLDFSVVAHYSRNIFDNISVSGNLAFTGEKCPQFFTIRDALFGTPVHISSWVFRNVFLTNDEFLNRLLAFPAADDPLLLYLLTLGKGYVFSEFMGIYRINSHSVWTPLPQWEKSFLMLCYFFKIHEIIGKQYSNEVRRKCLSTSISIFQNIVDRMDESEHNRYFMQVSLAKISWLDKLGLKLYFRMFCISPAFGQRFIYFIYFRVSNVLRLTRIMRTLIDTRTLLALKRI